MTPARHSLRRRVVAAFALFALATALCFSAFSLVFLYVVEDSFFDNMLRQEAAHQLQRWDAAGGPVAPLRGFVSVHRDSATFPQDLARQFVPAPRREYFGDAGRHYHVVSLAPRPHYLVAEVSSELVVRPRLPFIVSILGALGAVALAATAAIGWLLARRATAPLERLAEVVSGSAPGSLPRDFAATFPDNEIGALARQLEGAMRRIGDFIEREQQFTRDASHELRTPLAVIDGAARLLAARPLDAQAAAQVQRIASAATGMAQVVDTLLALAREELGAVQHERVVLLPLAESAVVRHAHLLEGKPVEVMVEVDAHSAAACSRATLDILLSNLVSNAFSHTASGTVRIYCDEGGLVVADSGPGIDPAVGGRLFEPGVKGAGSAGSGLGLSIAQRLAARSSIALSIDGGPAGTRAALHLPQFERFHKPSAA